MQKDGKMVVDTPEQTMAQFIDDTLAQEKKGNIFKKSPPHSGSTKYYQTNNGNAGTLQNRNIATRGNSASRSHQVIKASTEGIKRDTLNDDDQLDDQNARHREKNQQGQRIIRGSHPMVKSQELDFIVKPTKDEPIGQSRGPIKKPTPRREASANGRIFNQHNRSQTDLKLPKIDQDQ